MVPRRLACWAMVAVVFGVLGMGASHAQAWDGFGYGYTEYYSTYGTTYFYAPPPPVVTYYYVPAPPPPVYYYRRTYVRYYDVPAYYHTHYYYRPRVVVSPRYYYRRYYYPRRSLQIYGGGFGRHGGFGFGFSYFGD